MNEINYILARWRDAITDPPEDGWFGVAHDLEKNHVICGIGSKALRRGYQWLDVTNIPAVPRAAVQEAVQTIFDKRNALSANEKTINGWHMGIEEALDCLNELTGVTPSGVDIANAPEAQCPVCGYYCLGRGGFGCIDKPSMLSGVTPSEESHD